MNTTTPRRLTSTWLRRALLDKEVYKSVTLAVDWCRELSVIDIVKEIKACRAVRFCCRIAESALGDRALPDEPLNSICKDDSHKYPPPKDDEEDWTPLQCISCGGTLPAWTVRENDSSAPPQRVKENTEESIEETHNRLSDEWQEKEMRRIESALDDGAENPISSVSEAVGAEMWGSQSNVAALRAAPDPFAELKKEVAKPLEDIDVDRLGALIEKVDESGMFDSQESRKQKRWEDNRKAFFGPARKVNS